MKSVFGRLILVSIWNLYAIPIGLAQQESPLSNMDSLTEVSYQQMRERQASEQVTDSLTTSHSQVVLQQPETLVWPWWQYLLCLSLIVGAVYILRHLRRKPVTKN